MTAKTFKISLSSLLMAVLSGFLLFLSFPKFGTGWVVWVAIIPLFYALKGKSFRQSFTSGFTAGLICHIGIMYWITLVVIQYGYLPIYMGVAAMLFVAAYLSLYTGFFALGIRYLRTANIPVYVSAPLVWVILEYIKSHVLTGFPWENLGYALYNYLPLIQIADLTSVYGISFLIVFINALIFDVISSPWCKKTVAVKIGIGTALVGAVLIYGFYRMDEIGNKSVSFPVQQISLIQGNVDQNIKWNPQFQQRTMADYSSLTRKASASDRRLIIWPETAVPFFFQDRDDFHRGMVELAQNSQSWLLFGSPSYLPEGTGMKLFNSAFLLSPHGMTMAKYDKVHLVPYGEYVPLRKLFPFISKLVQGIGDFGTGKGYIPLTMEGHKIGVLICYEGIFPEAGRAYKKNGAGLLVNITNDAWFGRSSAPYQHLSMTVFRAVENRLYLARAANTGITAVIDPTGRVLSQTTLFEQTFLQGAVRFMNTTTFYETWGDVFVFFCGFILISSIIIAVKRRRGK